MQKFINQCSTCVAENPKTCNGKSCNKWKLGYLYRQKKINEYAIKHCGGVVAIKQNVWGYMHPDEYRRYLLSNPCDKCICEKWCDDACMQYMIHFQAKMEYIKRKGAKSL